MAKSRAQRKAEQRRRAQQQEQGRTGAELEQESRAQHDTQVPESADVIEAELAERGADLDQLKGKPGDGRRRRRRPRAPTSALREAEAEPADKISRRARRQEERERKAAREGVGEAAARPKAPAPTERQRGGVLGFFASCWAELKRVQWPDRDTLIQASAITLVFIAVMAAYLGVLDAVFNWLVQRIL